MRITSKHIRPSTVFFVAAIAVLGSVLLIQERKAARLRSVLAYYKSQSHEVVDRLHGKALLKWAEDCPLEEVIEQVKWSTPARPGWSVFPIGVPIEVDPIGLERAGRSLKSPVPAPPADVDLTLAEKLRAVLEPLGLACDVRDASLVITARDLVTTPVRPEDPEHE
jgi:hypothetical protein